MSLVLAVVYSHFADRTRKKFIRHHEKRKRSIDYAFQLLVEAKRKRVAGKTLRNYNDSNRINNENGKSNEINHNSDHLMFTNDELENETIHLPEWVNMMRYISKNMPPEVAESLFYLRKRKRPRVGRRYISRDNVTGDENDKDFLHFMQMQMVEVVVVGVN